MDDRVLEIDCVRVKEVSRSVLKERVAREALLELSINGEYVRSFIHSVGLEEQLVIGYLLSSGSISHPGMIKQITTEREHGYDVELNSIKQSQGEQRTSKLRSTHTQLLDILNLMKNNQHLHISTRGFHAALLYNLATDEWFLTEDIGRHNAVDKVIGYCVNLDFNLQNCVLVISGRLVSDIVSKCVNVGIPLIASMTVATDRGIEMAKTNNTTLVGSLSENGFWLYNEGRVEIRTQ